MASSGPSPSLEQWPSLLASHKQPRPPVPTGCGPASIPQETFAVTSAKPGGFCRPLASPTTRPPDPPIFPVHRPSFASVVRPTTSFRFPPIQLPARHQGTKDGKPMVAFTASEIQPGIQRLQHSLIAKFSSGRPPIDDVRHHLSEAWGIADKSTIGAMDARHILIILPTTDESNSILAHPLRKVCQSLFRLFRWTPDFHRRKEPTTITTWIKLPGLPSHLFDQGYISSIISSFGRFLAIDEKTKMLSNPSFARACMELDLSKPFPGEVWVSFGPDNGFWQPITYENKLLYCSKCKLHGHELSSCRRNKPVSTAREGVPDIKAAEGVPDNTQLTCDQLPNNFQTIESGKSSAQNQKINNRASEWITVQKKKKGKSITSQKANAEKGTTPPLAPKVAQDMGLHDTSVSVETENPSKEAEICPNHSNVEHDAEEHEQGVEQNAACIPLVDPHEQGVEQNASIIGIASDPPNHDIQNNPAIISEVQLIQAGDDDHIDIASAVVVYQDNNSNEDLQSKEVPLPEEIVQKISSYGSVQFYCEKDDDPVEARAFYLRLKATCEDDAVIFQAMEEAVNRARQAQKEGSDIPIEESDSSVDLSLILKKPRPSKKGSRFSGRSRPKKKDTNFVW